MAEGNFIPNRPQLAIGRKERSFAYLGLDNPEVTRIIAKVGTDPASYDPLDGDSALKGIIDGGHYILYTNVYYNGAPDLVNAVTTGLIPQTGVNVFAGQPTVFICTTAVSFAAAGITSGNTNQINHYREGVAPSYDPDDGADNAITGFELDGIYYIDPILDIDLSDYGVTEIRYEDEAGGHTIQDEGVSLYPRTYLNFIGAGVTATDNAVDDSTDVTIPGGTSYTDEQVMDVVAALIQNGTGITWVYNDVAGTLTPTVSGGGGTPGGADTQVQYNNAGAFGASGDMVFNATGLQILDREINIISTGLAIARFYGTGNVSTSRALFQLFRGTPGTATGWDMGANLDLASDNFILRKLTGGGAATAFTIFAATDIWRIAYLAGVGDRMVIAGANGDLSTQAIPSGGGVTTMAAIGSSPNANAATISGVTLTMQPASALFGGIVDTLSQTFAGLKIFNDQIRLPSGSYVTPVDLIAMNSAGTLGRVSNSNAREVLRMGIIYTPTSSTDATYANGTITYDDNFQYFRTSTGTWKKIALAAF